MTNCSELKKMMAHDYKDLLQVSGVDDWLESQNLNLTNV